MIPSERFHLACNELGWGDPKGGLWFFGIEEAFAWKEGQEEVIERHFGHNKYFRNSDVEKTRLISISQKPTKGDMIEAQISFGLSRSGRSTESILDAITKINPNTGIAHGNLYPLGKPRAKSCFPPCYLALFGFGNSLEEMRRYKAHVKDIRYDCIRKAYKELTPQAIVCFGKSCWPDFREVFCLSDSKETGLQVFNNERVILAPHWAFGHLEKHIERISNVLKGWRVTVN